MSCRSEAGLLHFCAEMVARHGGLPLTAHLLCTVLLLLHFFADCATLLLHAINDACRTTCEGIQSVSAGPTNMHSKLVGAALQGAAVLVLIAKASWVACWSKIAEPAQELCKLLRGCAAPCCGWSYPPSSRSMSFRRSSLWIISRSCTQDARQQHQPHRGRTQAQHLHHLAD